MTDPDSPTTAERQPALAESSLQPLSPHLAPCLALYKAASWMLLGLVVALMPLGDSPLLDWRAWLVAGVIGCGAIGVGLAWCEARRRAFALREHDLVQRRGLLVTRLQVLPLVRLQHIETRSNPLERWFGLVRLACFTAGGRGADLLIEGLPAAQAEALKQQLLDRLAGASPESST